MIAAVAEKVSIFVVDPRETAGHAGAEVDPSATENHGQASGHVFAGVIAHAFDDGPCSGVANREALASAARGKEPAAGRAVEGDVSEKGVRLALLSDATASANDEFAAAETLADEVVGEAFEREGHALCSKCSERLPRSAVQIET